MINFARNPSILRSALTSPRRFPTSARVTTRMTSTVNSDLYRKLAEFPTYRAAQFQSNNVIRATTSVLDHERVTKRQSVKTYVVSGSSVVSPFSPNEPETIASMVSPSGAHLAVLRESGDSTVPGGKRRYVEIWSGNKIKASKEVTHTHGAFYTDEYLSSLSFSPSETRLVYTAEAKSEDLPKEDHFAKYRFIPQFGESYPGKKQPTLFIFDWGSQENTQGPFVSSLSYVGASPNPTLMAHAVFASEDKVFATSYEYTKDGRILGVIYCPNRLTAIWDLSLPSLTGQITKSDGSVQCQSIRLTPNERSCRSPRVLMREGQSDLLVWLSNAVGGPHASCSSLHLKDLADGIDRTLVESVWDPQPADFPGLYITTLPTYPFVQLTNGSSKSTPYVVASSIWRSRSTVLLICLDDGKVKDLTPDSDQIHYSWTVLATNGKDQVICTRSALNKPPELVLGHIGSDSTAVWRIIAEPELDNDLRQRIEGLKTYIVSIPERYPTETIILRSQTQADAPCITFPHGGPHSTTITGFNAWSTAFALEGYTVSMPNYTGSLGFGEKYVKKLLGQIGSLDIQDCIATVRHLVDLGISSNGAGKQFLSGGSHGGFILGHLIGQFPDVFSGAVLRNPVVSLGEISTSDIPDWYYEESGLAFSAASVVTPEIYQKMFEMSPIAHIDAVVTPVMLLIGEQDKRVPNTQGINYYHALKARGKWVEMLCLKEDNHSLDSVEGQRISYEATKYLYDTVRLTKK